ncbi:MAG: ABC transporter permease subunit [Rothia sp. (in: high G+C Gram-positive bacteria)]|nr:ABC transporter permease subunit [Rothia sp. (in: high G+C Gram-positive bacteria)]
MKQRFAFRSVPWIFALPASLGLFAIVSPLVALALNIPWHQALNLLTEQSALQSAKLSVQTALLSTALCGILGIPLSLMLTKVLARSRWRVVGTLLYALIYAPVILSPVVSGLALTFFWGRKGVVGAWLYSMDINVAFTSAAVVITQIFVGLPFFVAAAVTTLRAIPTEYEELAFVEGATAWETTRKVLLPLAAPGIATAFLLAFARALGEYGATVTFAGNIAEKTRTIPLNIELMLSSNEMSQALGSSLMLISLYLIVLALSCLMIALQRLRRTSHRQESAR